MATPVVTTVAVFSSACAFLLLNREVDTASRQIKMGRILLFILLATVVPPEAIT
jgi:hypothetical protein